MVRTLSIPLSVLRKRHLNTRGSTCQQLEDVQIVVKERIEYTALIFSMSNSHSIGKAPYLFTKYLASHPIKAGRITA
ncbi:hypothetical protein HI914_04446 [Erysiphe necator]|nr:hypothetical protein HI914_04446 [Erysiphe necator]